jgi:hypothetical protein
VEGASSQRRFFVLHHFSRNAERSGLAIGIRLPEGSIDEIPRGVGEGRLRRLILLLNCVEEFQKTAR